MSDDWTVLSEESAADARMYLLTVREIAAGNSPDATLPMALLAHVRLDADPDAVSEAEFDALHP